VEELKVTVAPLGEESRRGAIFMISPSNQEPGHVEHV